MKLNLGENIRRYRKRIDWTQEQLANRLGVSCQSVSRWECGDGYPDMEHLPTMARLFSVTMDDLIGYGGEEDKLPSHEMQKKFRNVLRNGEIDEIVSFMRLIRYEYLDQFDHIYFPLTSVYSCTRPDGKLNESPKFMEELRLLVNEYLNHGTTQWVKTSLIELMIQLEDDEHFELLAEEHGIPEQSDLSINGILMKRAIAKKDDEMYRLTRAIRKMEDFYAFIENDDWSWSSSWRDEVLKNGTENLPDIPELNPSFCADQSRRKLEMLHTFNGVVPDEKHPVSGDGELDLWGIARVKIGFFYAAQLSACGEHDLALTVLEDCTSLIEQLYVFPDDMKQYKKCCKHNFPELTCKSPELAGITAYRSPVFTEGCDLPPDVCITYRPERDFRQIKAPGEYYHLGLLGGGQYFFLTKSNIVCEGFCSTWFDPIREHPRYLAVVERIRKFQT